MTHWTLYALYVVLLLVAIMGLQLRSLRRLERAGKRVHYAKALALPFGIWASLVIATGIAFASPDNAWIVLLIWFALLCLAGLGLYAQRAKRLRR
jgi:hypothetical protein